MRKFVYEYEYNLVGTRQRRIKFLLIFVTLILLANAGYNYVPVAYAGENFRRTAICGRNGLANARRLTLRK